MRNLLLVLIPAAVLYLAGCKSDQKTAPTPTIVSFSPTSAAEGETVTITGKNFSPVKSENSVTLNGVTATVAEASANQLQVTVPGSPNCSGKLKVTVGERAATAQENFTMKFGPAITSFTPLTGPKETVITITGSNFSPVKSANRVTLNSIELTVTQANATQLQVTVPANPLCFGTLKVTVDSRTGISAAEFVYEVTTYTVRTLAGSGTAGLADSDDPLAAKFSQPAGMSMDSRGNIYVADYQNHCIRMISPAGKVTTYAGSATAGSANGLRTSATFNYPNAVVVAPSGIIYVADRANNMIRAISPEGYVTTLAGSTTPGFVDGTGSNAKFAYPTDMALDKQGNLYVADFDNGKIRKVTPAGVVSTFASGMFQPAGISMDKAGNLYVTQYQRFDIMKINISGTVTTFASVSAFGLVGICADPQGNLYVVDRPLTRLYKISPSGQTSGLAMTYPSGESALNFPSSLFMDSSGNIYTGCFDNRIRKIACE